jgi:hypothetical protein
VSRKKAIEDRREEVRLRKTHHQKSSRKRGSLLALAALGAVATVLWRKKNASPPEGEWRDLSVVDGGDG